MKEVLEKVQQIQELWLELGRAKPNTSEYGIIVKKIRILSAEYQALVEARTKPKE
jgi:hypothetical protein